MITVVAVEGLMTSTKFSPSHLYAPDESTWPWRDNYPLSGQLVQDLNGEMYLVHSKRDPIMLEVVNVKTDEVVRFAHYELRPIGWDESYEGLAQFNGRSIVQLDDWAKAHDRYMTLHD